MNALDTESKESLPPTADIQSLEPSIEATTDSSAPDEIKTADADTSDHPELKDNSVSLRLNFIDFAGYPIEGLDYQIMIDGKLAVRGKTDDKGVCTPLTGLMPYSPLEILIKKDNSIFTSKHVGTIECGDMEMCGVAPSIKVDLKTDEHKGSPASSEVKATPPAAAKLTQETKPNAPPVGAAPIKRPKPNTQAQSCRNDVGNPLASFTDKFQDWAGRNRIPTLGLWTWKDFQPHAKGCTTPQEAPKTKAARVTHSKRLSHALARCETNHASLHSMAFVEIAWVTERRTGRPPLRAAVGKNFRRGEQADPARAARRFPDKADKTGTPASKWYPCVMHGLIGTA
jgi:hypothetical protein